jgi:uncharacterized protein
VTPTGRIAALHVYPVKACGATDLDVAQFDPRGIRGDRAFALTGPDREVLTQRQHPRLATVRPTYRDGALTLQAAHRDSATVAERVDGERLPVTVFGRPCLGVDQGDIAAEWFTDLLGTPCRLVRCPPDGGKWVNPARAVGETAYADAYPVTVISVASLDRLNAEIAEMGEQPVPMRRFRPNVVVAGWPRPHTEDELSRLEFGAVELRMTKRDDRCVVTTVDQETGARTRQPLRALGRYRVIDQEIMFGMFAMVERTGVAWVGDSVHAAD